LGKIKFFVRETIIWPTQTKLGQGNYLFIIFLHPCVSADFIYFIYLTNVNIYRRISIFINMCHVYK